MADVRIRSEIAGSVWRIEAPVGSQVQQGQTIILIESMKMEVPVLSPATGVLGKILVSEGDEIAEGQDVALVMTK